MKERFVENGIEYVRKGDYYLPNLAVPGNNHIIGKYGNLRKKFLKSSKKSLYSSLMLTGKLFEHLHEIDEKAQVILDEFIKNGESNAPDKATKQMEWVGYMNNLKHTAEEVIFTSGANYRITGDKMSYTRNLLAASQLSSRYNLKGGFIRAWNHEGTKHRTIIDTMMNLHLLYWASDVRDDDRFSQIANSHADMVSVCHVRPDGSVAHIIDHDIETGEIKEIAGQGYGVDSAWSRGQGWALYGFVLCYIHTGKKEYLDTAKKVAHYFISCVCDDYLPKADFRAPDEPVIIDSTAAGLAACGLIEIARAVPEYEKKTYINAAIKILKATEAACANYDENEDALILRGSHSYHREVQREIPIVYADFYFVEALFKLRGNDFLIW